jgi:sec-independent protein translocase protein TatB
MFDIGWSEMLVIGVVALIVVGPKDLPKMFHTLGEFTGKARSMAREFQSAMNAAAKDAGVDGLARDIRKVTDVTSGKGLKKHVTDAVGFDKIEDEFKSIGGDGVKKRQGPKGPESMPESTPETVPESVPFEAADFDDETDADEAAAAEHDAEHDAKMAREFSQVEAARLKRAEKAAKARQKAAHLRAQREADAEIQGRERPSGTGAPAARTTAPDQADSAPDSAPTSAPQTRDDQS